VTREIEIETDGSRTVVESSIGANCGTVDEIDLEISSGNIEKIIKTRPAGNLASSYPIDAMHA